MKNAIYIFVLSILLICCTNNSGNDVSKNVIEPADSIEFFLHEDTSNTKMLMTHSGCFQPCEDLVIDGINFTVVVNNGDTTHWSTTDRNFITPEGYGVLTSWNNISSDDQKSVQSMLGWAYYIELESGWQLAFCEGNSCTDYVPSDSSVVDWIFKRLE